LGLLTALEEIALIDVSPLRDFTEQAASLSNAALQAWMKEHPHPMLDDVMRWSKRSDELFDEYTQGLLPFDNVKQCLSEMAEKADIMVVSSASGKGLDKDWSFSGLTEYTVMVAGQETGSKEAQLKMGAAGKYPPQKILMIGDAPGDLEAARSIKALFFPVMPGSEKESWLHLRENALTHFFSGTYKGNYEDTLIKKFLELLGN
jgi:phosphoglycolate phosphatase-like HAD superfamily hydrolase